jgi:hypothetical protein
MACRRSRRRRNHHLRPTISINLSNRTVGCSQTKPIHITQKSYQSPRFRQSAGCNNRDHYKEICTRVCGSVLSCIQGLLSITKKWEDPLLHVFWTQLSSEVLRQTGDIHCMECNEHTSELSAETNLYILYRKHFKNERSGYV